MTEWLAKTGGGGSGGGRAEASRPVSALEQTVRDFDAATLDRVAAVALQAERIIESGTRKHLPVLRRNYRAQVRSLLAAVADSATSSASAKSTTAATPTGADAAAANSWVAADGNLALALHKATLSYYLSLYLHANNYHHLALLSDYILLIEVCCRYPAGSVQHNDADVLLDRCMSIVSEDAFTRHPDQCKACAAQPIVAALLEDWGRHDAAGKLYATHATSAAAIYGALHPATADAALQCATFHARANAHALCLRHCRTALSIVVLHAGLWNATAGQLNYHVGAQLRCMGLQSQAAFFFQRAADVFEFVASEACDVADGTHDSVDLPDRNDATGDGPDRSALGSALLWYVLASFQLHAVHREADNFFVALRHLREVRLLFG